jgi:hypothetical protein
MFSILWREDILSLGAISRYALQSTKPKAGLVGFSLLSGLWQECLKRCFVFIRALKSNE